MARPERTQVENRLVEGVAALGGVVEKFVSPNKKNIPDDIVCWPAVGTHEAFVEFVECKANGKGANSGQKRDHERRRKMGFNVLVLNTRDAVNRYLIWHRERIAQWSLFK